ncbi:MAG TPA: glycosyltransferase family 87 protein [Dehalococcoidia bacterium]|nr:glycosyltransferase family 87 protein [Dehalococcoidia bacterium]
MARLGSRQGPREAVPEAARSGLAGSRELLAAAGRVVLLAAAVLLAVYMAYKALDLMQTYEEIISTAYEAKGPPKFPEAGDITVFYTAGDVIVSEERSRLYDPDYFIPRVFETQGWQPGDVYAGDGKWSRFYNPPAFALVLAPLSLVDLHTAYLIVLGLNIAATAVLAVIMGSLLRWRQLERTLLILALLSYTPLYFVFQHAQSSLLLALVLAGSYLLWRSGAWRAGAVLAVLGGMKPQWLALPPLVAARRHPRALLWSAAAALVVLVLPFGLVGVDGFRDYIDITLDRGGGDLSDQTYSSAILSWSGFMRAITGSPQPALSLAAAGLTLAVFAHALLKGDLELGMAAAILSTLLVVPHSHPQDWVVVFVAVAVALSRSAPTVSRVTVWACFLAVYFAANDWPNASATVAAGHTAAYWVTLAGFGLLLLVSALPYVEARLSAKAQLAE